MTEDTTGKPADGRRPRRRRTGRVVLGALVLAIVAAGAGLVWFFNRDVPEEASIESALGAVAGSTTTAVPGTTRAPGSEQTTDGAWKVDTSVGSFDFEEATASFAGFRIQEELRGLGSTTAVGRTPAVTGALELEGATLTAATIEVDLTAIITNDSRRDGRVQSALDTDRFPTATFTLSEPVDFGAVPGGDESVTVTASGDLAIHGVTRRVEMPLEARLVDDLIIVVGSTTLVFSDYGVAVPTAPIVLSAEDEGILEVQLWFTRA